MADGASLNRFLERRGPILAGLRYGASSKANFVVAGLLLGTAAATAVAASVSGEPGIFAGVAGPLGGAVANLIVGFRMRSAAKGELGTEVRLSPEARRLLIRWVKSAHGWRFWHVGSFDRETPSAEPSAVRGRLRRRVPASEFVHPALYRVMVPLAEQYNRVHGLAMSLKGEPSPAADKMRRTLALAADEAMAEALRLAALFDAYPESGEVHLQQIGVLADRLRELADRSEGLRLRLQAPGSPDRSLLLLRAALEELELEESAHQELEQGVGHSEAQERKR